ncbi:MAG: T9SS type A sorting domain-containing protein [Bacteroidales bacterium]|nr:T9SS type A sorting domain-containing protein [Bacteroidales bacterium]
MKKVLLTLIMVIGAYLVYAQNDCEKTLPYTEDFEGLETYDNTSFPECWSKIFSYQSGMEYDCPTISPTGADGSSGSLFFMLQGPTSQFAISPKIDPTVPISSTTVKLRYKSTKTTEVGLILGVMSDPTDTLTFVAIDTIHRVGATSTWELKEINMAAYSGEGHYIALWLCGRACSAAYPSCFVDNFAVEMSASCTAPVQIAASVNNDEATISWTPTDNTTAVRLYYKASDEETYQSVDISAGTNQYTIEGLSLATNYEYYLVTICGDDESQPSATATFSTPCEEITEFPWTEDFENGLVCWSLDGSANAVNWTISTNPANPSCAPASGSNVATFAAFSFTDGSWATMTSPAIDLTESRALTFKLYQYGPMEDYFSEQPYDDKIEIYVNDEPSTDDATLIATVNGYSAAEGWKEYTFAIPQQTSSRSYITLKGISNYGYNLHIDDLSIENTTEIEEGSNTTLSIYPNPAHDYATLNINGLESVSEIILTDMCGKVVRTYIVNKGDNEILIEKGGLSAGIYVIRLTSGEKTIVEKVTFQ